MKNATEMREELANTFQDLVDRKIDYKTANAKIRECNKILKEVKHEMKHQMKINYKHPHPFFWKLSINIIHKLKIKLSWKKNN